MRKRISPSKTHLDEAADRAIELARKMSPGSERIHALKEAGLLRQMAELARKIADREDASAASAGIEKKRNAAMPVKRSKQDPVDQAEDED